MKKVLISGGGTGGHIFPAIAIANELKAQFPEVEILFVGAEGKMEMEKVPQAGYKIIGLPIVGLQRKFTVKNLILPFKLFKSLLLARKTIKQFTPDVAIGVGGYASGPILQMSNWMKVPTILQEQNSFAGKTNILLGKKAKAICTAYPNMERFFPKASIVETGNPVRFEVTQIDSKKEVALAHFSLDPSKKTILVIGGSLGAKTLNDALISSLDHFAEQEVQVLWQCGKTHFSKAKRFLEERPSKWIHLYEFIYEMDLAYASADIIISRAGAIAVSELTLIGKPSILVPSPNVSEDHQTHNAMALVSKDAAILVKDDVAISNLFETAFNLLQDTDKQRLLARNIKVLGKPDATKDIVKQVIKHSK